MLKIKKPLADNLKGAKKIAILGVGSSLRGDDAAGLLVAEALKRELKSRKTRVFFGETAPENLTGAIKKFNPTHLIIIDSADLKERPGSVSIFSPEYVGGISFSTHSLPLKLIAEYLFNSISCKTVILGIQPAVIKFNFPVSKEIKAAVKALSRQIKEALCISITRR